FFAVVKKRTRRMSRIENPREAIKDGSTGIFCLSITCQYGLLTKNKSCVSEKLEGASTPDISAFIS
ncbi:hypothetical protein EGO58_11160, partial [Limosilactobacillus reuteri]